MDHTFDTVDEKVAEAEFFLQQMSEMHLDMFAFKCYLSAYLSASRTTTLALQQFKHLPGFDIWYAPHQERLKLDPLAKFLLDMRNSHVHGGPNPVSGGMFHKGEARYFFSQRQDQTHTPLDDVLSKCRRHFITLLQIVHDCYVKLGVYVDPQQHYTKEHFAAQGRTIGQVEAEVLGWICTSLIDEGFDEDSRWQELRAKVDQCKINHLFYSYLGRPTPQPIEPDYFADFEFTAEEKGWIHVPAGFKSLEEYQQFAGIVPGNG